MGMQEIIFILVLALLIFGPKRLPQIGRSLGKAMAELRRASTELQRSINLELEGPPDPPPARRPPHRGAPEEPPPPISPT
jgi:sec-independent protein translocase protein TatA